MKGAASVPRQGLRDLGLGAAEVPSSSGYVGPQNPLLSAMWRSQTSIGCHRQLYSFVESRNVRKLDLSASKEILSTQARGSVHALALDAIEERFLLTGSYDGIIALYDLHRGKRSATKEKFKPESVSVVSTGLISSVQWYPIDCGLFVSSTMFGEAFLHDTNTLEPVTNIKFPQFKILSARFHPSPGRRPLVATALSDGSVRLWDFLSGDAAHTIHCHSDATSCVDWHPLHEFQILSSSMDGTTKMWDIRKGSHASPILVLDWRKDHAFAAEKARDSILDHGPHSSEPRYQHSLSGTALQGKTAPALGRAHDAAVCSCRFTPTGSHILTAGNDGKVRLWSSSTGRFVNIHYDVRYHSFLSHRMEMATLGEGYGDVVFLPDMGPSQAGRQPQQQQQNSTSQAALASQIVVLPVHSPTGEPIARLKGHWSEVEAIVYRKSTQQVISAAKDKLILLWEAPPLDGGRSQRDQFYDYVREGRVSLSSTSGNYSHGSSLSHPSRRLASLAQRLSKQQQHQSNATEAQAKDASTTETTSGTASSKGPADGTRAKETPRRLFVPPIIRQYREEARQASKRRAEGETEDLPAVAEPKPKQSRLIDWDNIDSLFASLRSMEK